MANTRYFSESSMHVAISTFHHGYNHVINLIPARKRNSFYINRSIRSCPFTWTRGQARNTGSSEMLYI